MAGRHRVVWRFARTAPGGILKQGEGKTNLCLPKPRCPLRGGEGKLPPGHQHPRGEHGLHPTAGRVTPLCPMRFCPPRVSELSWGHRCHRHLPFLPVTVPWESWQPKFSLESASSCPSPAGAQGGQAAAGALSEPRWNRSNPLPPVGKPRGVTTQISTGRSQTHSTQLQLFGFFPPDSGR